MQINMQTATHGILQLTESLCVSTPVEESIPIMSMR